MLRRLIPLLLAPLALRSQVSATPVKPGWQWTMDSVRTVVNAVRAGRSLAPAGWPGGSRVAVLLSFDVDNETIPLRFGEPTVGTLASAQYGARRGLGRLVRLLDAHRIPASFFIPSVSLALTPGMADTIRKSGRHEFAVHGWIHELNATLPDSAERALLTKAVAELTALTGVKPTGYRAPSWNFSPNTLSILRDMGFRYESSLMADDSPYELLQRGRPTGIVELPVEWILDDAPLFDPRGQTYMNPRDVAKNAACSCSRCIRTCPGTARASSRWNCCWRTSAPRPQERCGTARMPPQRSTCARRHRWASRLHRAEHARARPVLIARRGRAAADSR